MSISCVFCDDENNNIGGKGMRNDEELENPKI